MAMPAPAFDPLVDLDGLWTTKLAERYLPLPGVPVGKYECVDGRLVMSPTEVGTNSWGEGKLLRTISDAAEAAGLYVFPPVNLMFRPDRWIQPDVTVLHTLPQTDEEDLWVPATYATMVVEFVSRGSRKRDFIDKPDICAKGGVPYFMRVELVRRLRHASVELSKLVDGEYQPTASGVAGSTFKADEPFPMQFDPRSLLP